MSSAHQRPDSGPMPPPPQPQPTLRRTLFHVLHKPSPAKAHVRYINYMLAGLIVINCMAVALETDAALFARYHAVFKLLDHISGVIFVIEYLLRVWSCVEQEGFSHPLWGRLRYVGRPLAMLDLIVLLSFLSPFDTRFLRIFRIGRLLRILHLGDYERSLRAVTHAIGKRRAMLVVSVILMLIAIYFAASLLYLLEHQAQPDKFDSIPDTLWWAVTTLTTIGYGDIYPITPWGKLVASVLSILGIGVFALPTAILTAAILDGSHAVHPGSTHHKCPHCGKKLE
jgi:voltage-gated potassium channel